MTLLDFQKFYIVLNWYPLEVHIFGQILKLFSFDILNGKVMYFHFWIKAQWWNIWWQNKYTKLFSIYSSKVPLYRYWNPRIVDHFYTANYNELRRGNHNWKYEGVQCRLLRHRYSGTVPLYRYWSGRDHFYTTNIREIGTSKPGNNSFI